MIIGNEIIFTAILSLPLIQGGQLSATGERMGRVITNVVRTDPFVYIYGNKIRLN